MVETQQQQREFVYTTDLDDGPSTTLAVLVSLLIVAALGFMVYFFSHNASNGTQPVIIERQMLIERPGHMQYAP